MPDDIDKLKKTIAAIAKVIKPDDKQRPVATETTTPPQPPGSPTK